MDEVFEPNFTKEKLLQLSEYSALYFYIVNLIDDGYSPDISFWNIRAWRNVGDFEWERKPLHCGLAPKWAYHYANYAPFIVEHYGLKDAEDRQRKIERYEKYDPKRQHIIRQDFYDHLKSTPVREYDVDRVHQEVVEHLKEKQKPKMPKQTGEKRWYRILREEDGFEFEVEEKYLDEQIKRPGFKLIGPIEVTKMATAEAPVIELHICDVCGFEAPGKDELGDHKAIHNEDN